MSLFFIILHFILRAKALQTVVQLMGERELFEYWSDTYKVHHVDWTQEKAAMVLETWQNRFAEEVRNRLQKETNTTPYNVYAFSTATLNNILKQFSELNVLKVAIGYVIMVSALYTLKSKNNFLMPLQTVTLTFF